MPSLLVKVQRKMTIVALRKVRSALEGEYSSVFKGRSMDFDDLRLYAPGDDIKDIDWKATARTGQMLIKRYVAVRKYNIMLVVDTGRSMAAVAPSGENKKDVAVMAAGVIASVALKHGDPIGLVAGNAQNVTYMPLKDTRPNAERVLQHIDTHIDLDSPESDLVNVLEYVRRNIKKRMMLVVISDNLRFAAIQEQLLRRLGAQHELLFMSVGDVDPNEPAWSNKDVYDVNQRAILPTYIRSQKKIEEAYRSHVNKEWDASTHVLERLRISSVRIQSEQEIIAQIVRLLERQKHARR